MTENEYKIGENAEKKTSSLIVYNLSKPWSQPLCCKKSP